MRIVDVHAHCYPPSYLKELRRIGIGEEGGIGVFMPEWSSTEERIAEMDALGEVMWIIGHLPAYRERAVGTLLKY